MTVVHYNLNLYREKKKYKLEMVMKKNRLKNREENEIFLVERIIDKRIRDNGQEEFLLKWKGFSE